MINSIVFATNPPSEIFRVLFGVTVVVIFLSQAVMKLFILRHPLFMMIDEKYSKRVSRHVKMVYNMRVDTTNYYPPNNYLDFQTSCPSHHATTTLLTLFSVLICLILFVE